MDVSKLPRLSNTQAEQQRQQQEPQQEQQQEPPVANATVATNSPASPHPDYRNRYDDPPHAGGGAEAWISIAVGVILILMSPRIFQYFLSPSSFTWTFNDAQGNPLKYTQTVFFWGDLALAAFAIVLIVEGLVIAFARRRAFVALAFGLTALATALNLGFLGYAMSKGFGFQIYSALAVAFGVYIGLYQWKLLRGARY